MKIARENGDREVEMYKKCPFCGKSPILREEAIKVEGKIKKAYKMTCVGDGCIMNVMIPLGTNVKQLKEFWNKRHLDEEI